jgi:16S rRNA (guanine527-N7)-methyltransferase
LDEDAIRHLLQPFVAPFPGTLELSGSVIAGVSAYLDLLIRWNARVSLTAIRDPEQIVTRHFGESFFTAGHLARLLPPGATLLDYGSGPGFPGLPVQMALPGLRVTVAEVQARKVAFLREVVRTLGLAAEIWPHRVEAIPAETRFDAVTVRAVEKMGSALAVAQGRVSEGGWLTALVGSGMELEGGEAIPMPGAEQRRLLLWPNDPRGTFADETV